MGAVLIAPHFQATSGQLGTTFGGNHLACAAALAVLDVIEDEHLIDNAAETGAYLIACLRDLQSAHACITDIRGRGLMVGVDFDGPIKAMRTRLVKEQHVFTGAASTNILRLLPPLCLTRSEVDDFIERLSAVL